MRGCLRCGAMPLRRTPTTPATSAAVAEVRLWLDARVQCAHAAGALASLNQYWRLNLEQGLNLIRRLAWLRSPGGQCQAHTVTRALRSGTWCQSALGASNRRRCDALLVTVGDP